MGSILTSRHSNQNVWGFWESVRAAITGDCSLLERLKMQGSDEDEDELEATGLIEIPGIIRGLIRTESYSRLSKFITDNFDVTKGTIFDDNQPSNFFEFPYDWRRDNRISANTLQNLINTRLNNWRQTSPTAKVIIIAHSMGGLVARYYLEVLGGWRDCRALITLGTPYSGAGQAVNYLANGHNIGFANLTDIVRSFTSVHQLMSTYPIIRNGSQYSCVKEIPNIARILNINSDKLQTTWSFHDEIEEAIKNNENNNEYLKDRYEKIVFVGKDQKTEPLSFNLVNGTIQESKDLPQIKINNQLIDQEWFLGDGTVSRLSAIPPELRSVMSNKYYFAETHSSLQVNSAILDALRELLRDGGANGELESSDEQRAMISLELQDVYISEKPVEISATLLNLQPGTDIGELQAIITSVENNQEMKLNFEQQTGEDSSWILRTNALKRGLYRLRVESYKKAPLCPKPIQDIFAVA